MENNLTEYKIGTCRFCNQSMALERVCGSWEEAENAATAACKCEEGKDFRRAAQEKATIQEIFGKDDPEAQKLICTLADAVREGYILGATLKLDDGVTAKLKEKEGVVVVTRAEKQEHQRSI